MNVDLAVSIVWQRLEYIKLVCDGSMPMLIAMKQLWSTRGVMSHKPEMSDKTQTDRFTDNVQFFVWHGPQNLCQTMTYFIVILTLRRFV